MSAGTYFAFLAAAAVIIVIPGPTNVAIVSDSISAGMRKALGTVGGAALSHAAFIVVTAAGIGTLIAAYPRALDIIKWFGVLYLALQGVRLIVRKPALLDPGKAPPAARGFLRCVIKGFVVNSTNPKALLFYAALFPPFVSPAEALIPQLIILATTFLIIFVVVGTAHALLGQKAKKLLNSRAGTDLGNRIAGSIMIGAAAWIAVK
jgi:threonine/homoserine/homoserine lactone efflux protein